MIRRATAAAAVVLACLTPPAYAEVDLGGTPVEVSTDAGDPFELTAGLWSDTLDGPGASAANVHRFSYTRTMAGSTVLMGLVAVSPEVDGADSVQVSVTAPDGTPCGTEEASSGSLVAGAAFGPLVSVGPEDVDDLGSPCVSAEVLAIAVSRGTASFTSDLPVALRIAEEAPVVGDPSGLPVAAETPRVAVPRPTDPQPVQGAESFEQAPTLEPGTYADAVTEGSARLYRVRLDWGQAISARVDVPGQQSIEGSPPTVNLTLFDPLRNAFSGAVEDSANAGQYDDDGTRLFEGTPAVAYLNRFDDQEATVPGDYWVSVTVSPATDRPPVDVPVEISLDVVGEPSGAPEFPQVLAGPRGSPVPDGYSAQTPYLIGDGQFSADVSGTPRVPGEAAGADSDTRTTAGLALGGVSLLCCLLGIGLLRRRSRTLSRAAAR